MPGCARCDTLRLHLKRTDVSFLEATPGRQIHVVARAHAVQATAQVLVVRWLTRDDRVWFARRTDVGADAISACSRVDGAAGSSGARGAAATPCASGALVAVAETFQLLIAEELLTGGAAVPLVNAILRVLASENRVLAVTRDSNDPEQQPNHNRVCLHARNAKSVRRTSSTVFDDRPFTVRAPEKPGL